MEAQKLPADGFPGFQQIAADNYPPVQENVKKITRTFGFKDFLFYICSWINSAF